MHFKDRRNVATQGNVKHVYGQNMISINIGGLHASPKLFLATLVSRDAMILLYVSYEYSYSYCTVRVASGKNHGAESASGKRVDSW